ncbi:PEP-CTERM sorting domain-containing protein [Stenomitos frigidus]|uniref:PEP-CTERM sorting domain-containing protein n=1 Tax=Stenomitos frigidus ULC18 TaxID=2107698 RepID=A0A2T1DTD3_9CYAN|nr:PEP-CTERM sorting domain-containing protein [Stenomitos frigidus]PSB23735.1 hypothetical protein C7B82_29835 [Stenomitos frigidus ULC18]
MKLLGTTQTLFLAIFPIVAASVTALPGQAATFALSEANATFSNFNLLPDSTSTDAVTSAIALSFGGNVASAADANALFQVNPPEASNLSVSQASGQFGSYLGLADSQATVIGRFLVSDLFQFIFQTNLNLIVAADHPTLENANASGALLVSVFNSTDPNKLSPLDFFTIAGRLDTSSQLDFLQGESSNHFTFTPTPVLNTLFGETTKSAQASAAGSYQRVFETPTYITLVESKVNHAEVQAVPEPSGFLGLCLGGAVLVYRSRRQAAKRDGIKN